MQSKNRDTDVENKCSDTKEGRWSGVDWDIEIDTCILLILYMVDGSSQVVLVVKNPPANAGDLRLGFDPWVGKIPCWRAWQPTPVFLPGESHGQRSLVGYGP